MTDYQYRSWSFWNSKVPSVGVSYPKNGHVLFPFLVDFQIRLEKELLDVYNTNQAPGAETEPGSKTETENETKTDTLAETGSKIDTMTETEAKTDNMTETETLTETSKRSRSVIRFNGSVEQIVDLVSFSTRNTLEIFVGLQQIDNPRM